MTATANKAAAEIVVMDNKAVRQTIAIRAVMRIRGAVAAAMANKAEVTKNRNRQAASVVAQEEASAVDGAVAAVTAVVAAVAAAHTAEVVAPVEVAVSIELD